MASVGDDRDDLDLDEPEDVEEPEEDDDDEPEDVDESEDDEFEAGSSLGWSKKGQIFFNRARA